MIARVDRSVQEMITQPIELAEQRVVKHGLEPGRKVYPSLSVLSRKGKMQQ